VTILNTISKPTRLNLFRVKVVNRINNGCANVPYSLALLFFSHEQRDSISGLILPSYNDSNNRGFSLQNLGYYFALSDNYDLTVLGDYYTNGSYGLRFESSYAKDIISGNINVRFENLITSERGYPDYLKQNIYNIQWSQKILKRILILVFQHL
jgi:hypothetical protein